MRISLWESSCSEWSLALSSSFLAFCCFCWNPDPEDHHTSVKFKISQYCYQQSSHSKWLLLQHRDSDSRTGDAVRSFWLLISLSFFYFAHIPPADSSKPNVCKKWWARSSSSWRWWAFLSLPKLDFPQPQTEWLGSSSSQEKELLSLAERSCHAMKMRRRRRRRERQRRWVCRKSKMSKVRYHLIQSVRLWIMIPSILISLPASSMSSSSHLVSEFRSCISWLLSSHYLSRHDERKALNCQREWISIVTASPRVKREKNRDQDSKSDTLSQVTHLRLPSRREEQKMSARRVDSRNDETDGRSGRERGDD